ncbi:MAG: hydroxyacid dehydrogenase [Bacteroidales bacterium]|nr:hydroxyacid dehydrogenase [Bacteroidales bacterium]
MKIVLLEPIGITSINIAKIKAGFEALEYELISYDSRPENDEEIIERANKADVIVLSNLPISENVIKECENLKMISVAFAGVDHIPMDLCRERNIIVSNGGGYSNHAVAELVIGSAINLFRKINWSNSQTRKLSTREGFLGSELHGKTFGIIGFGKIGQETAKLAQAFGCRVVSYNRSSKSFPNIEFVELDYLLKESDIISLHIPLSNETKGLLGNEKLQLLKSTSVLINTARGAIVDYYALTDLLKKDLIAGAAIDVYEKEPPLDKSHPLFEAPNTILLPHIGYATNEAIELRGNIIIDNIMKWLKGDPQNVMN